MFPGSGISFDLNLVYHSSLFLGTLANTLLNSSSAGGTTVGSSEALAPWRCQLCMLAFPALDLLRMCGEGWCMDAYYRALQAVATVLGLADAFAQSSLYGTFRLNFHRFYRLELDLRGHTQT